MLLMNIFFICEDTQILNLIKQEVENKYEFITTTFLSKTTKITKDFGNYHWSLQQRE